MGTHRRKVRLLAIEGTKVLLVFVGLCLLQVQILDMRTELGARAGGLAVAHARTRDALGDTREFIGFALEDSNLELARTREALEASVERLRRERSHLITAVDRLREELVGTEPSAGEPDEPAASPPVRSPAAPVRDGSEATRLARAADAGARDAGRMKRAMLLPTVQLRGNGTVGSGVLVYSRALAGDGGAERAHATFVLTACHVVHEVLGEAPSAGSRLDDVRVSTGERSDGMERLSATVVLHDADRDTALLRLDDPRPFPHLARWMPRERLPSLDVFSPVYAVGCPLGNGPMPTLGEISSRSKKVGDQTFWMLNAPIFFGNSGGGVYLAPGYELVGVSSMIHTYGKRHPMVVPHMGLFVPLESIYGWLEAEGFGFVADGGPVPAPLVAPGGETGEPGDPVAGPPRRGPPGGGRPGAVPAADRAAEDGEAARAAGPERSRRPRPDSPFSG